MLKSLLIPNVITGNFNYKLMENDKRTEFEKSGEQKDIGLFGEFVGMMKQNKKYWLIPLVLILILFGVLIILGSSAAAPFIYTLF
jgi:hypothetical protein